MNKDDRKRLLRTEDLEIKLRDDISLASFVAGFRLAWGIMVEMNTEPPYSFADEEEQRACEVLERNEVNS